MWHYVRLTDPYLKHADPLYDGFNPYVGLARLPFFKITMNKLACVLLSIRLIHNAIKQPWLRDMQLVNLKCSWMDSWLYQLWSSPSSSYLHLHNYHNNYRIIITVIIIITINIIHHHHQQQHPVNRSSTWRQSSKCPWKSWFITQNRRKFWNKIMFPQYFNFPYYYVWVYISYDK